MKLTRINPDHSWLLETTGLRLVVDPWLLGPEIDGFGWFHTQHLPQAAWPIAALGPLDAIVITQPFSDHCHEETLRALPAAVPILAVPAAYRRLKRLFPEGRTLVSLDGTFCSHSSLPEVTLTPLPTSWWDPTHGGLWISSEEGSVLIAPHGYRNRSLLRTLRTAMARPCTVLAPSMQYRLPFFLGGTVNLGLQNAYHLCQDVHAHAFVETHSSDKPATGMARALARMRFPDFQQVKSVVAIAQELPYVPPRA
jgi:hypothetical protein